MVKLSAKVIAIAFFAVAIVSGIAFNPTQKAEAHSVNSQVVTPVYEELILQIPKVNEKNSQTIAQAMVANPGVQFSGYCKTFNLLMFVVDRTVQVDNNFLEQTMHTQELEYYIKVGTTIQQMYVECGIDNSTESNPE